VLLMSLSPWSRYFLGLTLGWPRLGGSRLGFLVNPMRDSVLPAHNYLGGMGSELLRTYCCGILDTPKQSTDFGC
jgi:hypothetical protein